MEKKCGEDEGSEAAEERCCVCGEALVAVIAETANGVRRAQALMLSVCRYFGRAKDLPGVKELLNRTGETLFA